MGTNNLPQKIEWQAQEYEFHKKSPEWFWALGIITLAVILAAVVINNLLFAVLAILGGFSIALYGARKPKTVAFKIDPRGITVEDKLYDYQILKKFWINYDPPQRKEMFVESKKTFSPLITIELGDIDPGMAREYLLRYIKEEKIEEPIITTLARILRI